MRAATISDAVERRLRREHAGQPTLYRRELGICVGAGRVDVAAVNGSLTGCEIKSAEDGLGRLPSQIDLYGRVLDFAILAVERVYPARVGRLVPGWWGLWHVTSDEDGAPSIEVLRSPQHNPNVQPLAVAQLLWRAEAFDCLRERGLHMGLASATRWRLWERLAEQVPLLELQTEVRHRLKARQDW